MVRKKRRGRRGGQPTGNHPRIKARRERGYHPGSQRFGAANEPSAMMKHDQPYNPPIPKKTEDVEEEFDRRGFVTDGSTSKKKRKWYDPRGWVGMGGKRGRLTRKRRKRHKKTRRGGGKKKAQAKTQKLVKARRRKKRISTRKGRVLSPRRKRKKLHDNPLYKGPIFLDNGNIEFGDELGEITQWMPGTATSNAESNGEEYKELMELLGYNNDYSSEENDTLGNKASDAQFSKGTYAQLPPLIQDGKVLRNVNTNTNAAQLASALQRRRRSPSPLPVFNGDEYFNEYDIGFGEILPIGSKIVGHGEKNGKRFYKIRLGPEKIPRGFRDAGKPHNLRYAYTKISNENFDAKQLELEATGLPDLQKLIDDYVANHPDAGEENSISSGYFSESNGGHRIKKQRGGINLSPKFRYAAQDFLDNSKSVETTHAPSPWW